MPTDVAAMPVWVTRTLKKPIAVATDMPSLNPETNVIFSPDGAFVLTGTAGSQAGVLEGSAEAERLKDGASYGSGKVVILNSKDLSVVRKLGESEPGCFQWDDGTPCLPVHNLDISPASVLRVLWNDQINQVSAAGVVRSLTYLSFVT